MLIAGGGVWVVGDAVSMEDKEFLHPLPMMDGWMYSVRT